MPEAPLAVSDSKDLVAVFIDGSNLYHALRENFSRTDLNFAEFVRKLCGGRRLYRTYYYNVLQEQSLYPEGYREQQEFLDAMRKTPYMEVRLGHTKLRQGVPVEKGIDIMLATDLLQYGFNRLYDVAILVSGDGDFAYALQTAKNMGKHVEVAYFERNVSKDLQEIADQSHVLNRAFFDGLWWGRRPASARRRRPGGKPKVAIQASQPAGLADNRPPEPSFEAPPVVEVSRNPSEAIPLPPPRSIDIFH